MHIPQSIQNALLLLMNRKKMTAKELADFVGVDASLISLIYNGKRPFTKELAAKFDDAGLNGLEFLLIQTDYDYYVYKNFKIHPHASRT